jgi:hypothetical protein
LVIRKPIPGSGNWLNTPGSKAIIPKQDVKNGIFIVHPRYKKGHFGLSIDNIAKGQSQNWKNDQKGEFQTSIFNNKVLKINTLYSGTRVE